jgi:hypothetical protein
MKLSNTQVIFLAEVANGGLTQLRAQVLSRGWKKTMARLEALGLVVFMPYAKPDGRYKLTPEGRAQVAQMLKSGVMVKW